MLKNNEDIEIHWEVDPGHGWLAVSKADCVKAGICDKISAYSYFDEESQIVYLEEDCDAGLFLDAIKDKFPIEFFRNIKETHREETFVRELPSFNL